jgi:hypothetical protein
VRALLLKPAALGAAIGLALFGVVVLLVSSFAAHASVADSGSSCDSVPTTGTVLTSSNTAVTGASASRTTLTTSAIASRGDSSSSDDDSPGPTPTDTSTPSDTTTPSDSTTTATPADTSTTSASSADTNSSDQSPDPTTSTSPDPSPSSSTSPAPIPQLCVLVQSYPSSGDVLAGDPASYVVWAWSTGADSSNVSVTASVTAASYLGSPGFSICPSASGVTCTIDSLPVGQVYELLASVPVTSDAPTGTGIELTATATATGDSSDSSNATDTVVSPTAAAGSTSTSDGDTSTGAGGDVVPPLISLPAIPGTGVTATDPSDLFPTVNPSPSSGSLGLPPAEARRVPHATEAAYAVPIDPRLLGAQILGLVALAGAVTIAIVRLSLRKQQLAPSGPASDPADPPTASS